GAGGGGLLPARMPANHLKTAGAALTAISVSGEVAFRVSGLAGWAPTNLQTCWLVPRHEIERGYWSAPNTFFARLVAAAAGFWRMLASCSAITLNRPLSVCSVT